MKTIKLIILSGIVMFLTCSISIGQNINGKGLFQLADNGIDEVTMVESNKVIISNHKQLNTDTLPIFNMDLGLFAYPNPTSDILYLDKGENDMLHIRVFSCEGKALFSLRTWDQVTELDFSQYERAYYILNVSNGTYSNTIKIWKS